MNQKANFKHRDLPTFGSALSPAYFLVDFAGPSALSPLSGGSIGFTMDNFAIVLHFSPSRLYAMSFMDKPGDQLQQTAVNPHRPSFVATRIEATLADRTWSTQTLEGVPCFRAFFLRRGTGVFVARGASSLQLSAPQILWLPFAERGEFRLLAGGDGAAILATDDVVWRTIAESRMGAQLRPLIDRTLLAPASQLGPRLPEMEALFGAFERETHDPGPGASAMTSLYLGLLLMHLWRSCGLARESDALDAGAPTAQRFRQLVELHYRDNLGVNDFAGLLGVTRSHLHFACLRALGRPPRRIVHERLLAEARLRLRETARPIEQVGYGLGFRDPAYFNRFFRRMSGLTPGAYRRAARIDAPQEPTSFAAWP